MAEKDRNLSSKKQRAIIALVTEDSITSAAKAARVSERSIHRWQHDPEFKRALNTASQMLQVSVINKLRASKTAIMDSIKEMIEDKSIPPQVRAKTALEAFKTLSYDQSLQISLGEDPVFQILSDEARMDEKLSTLRTREDEAYIREEELEKSEEEYEKNRQLLKKVLELHEKNKKGFEEEKLAFEKEKKRMGGR